MDVASTERLLAGVASVGHVSVDVASPGHGSIDVASPGHGSIDVASPGHGSIDVASPGHGSIDVASPGHCINADMHEYTLPGVEVFSDDIFVMAGSPPVHHLHQTDSNDSYAHVFQMFFTQEVICC